MHQHRFIKTVQRSEWDGKVRKLPVWVCSCGARVYSEQGKTIVRYKDESLEADQGSARCQS